MITIREYEVAIDVVEELEPFNLERMEQNGAEIRACSPFRNERNPSFYINVETGLWKDFGSHDDMRSQGNLVTLLAHLHQLSYEDTEAYLLEKYNVVVDEVEGLDLKINIQMDKKENQTFNREDLKPYLFRKKDYLLKRGISEEIQAKFVVGYCKKDKAVAFFWRDSVTGKVVSVKFRNIRQKQFYYLRGGQPVSRHVFGLYNVIQEGHRKVYLVESEIDAMYLWTHGIPSVAVGGSFLSDMQRRRLIASGVTELVIATDNDNAGEKLAKQVEKSLSGHIQMYRVALPNYANDINDVKKEDIKKVIDSEEPITLNLDLQLVL